MVMWSTFGATKPIILVTDLAAVVGLIFISPSSEKAEFFDSLGQNPEIYATSFVEFVNGNCS